MNLGYKSKLLEEIMRDIKNQLPELPLLNFKPEIFYDAQLIQRGFLKKGHLEVKAIEIAELKVLKLSYDYRQVFSDTARKLIVYIGGINTLKDFLIVGQNIEDKTGNLILPAGLFLRNLIGYRTVEKL